MESHSPSVIFCTLWWKWYTGRQEGLERDWLDHCQLLHHNHAIEEKHYHMSHMEWRNDCFSTHGKFVNISSGLLQHRLDTRQMTDISLFSLPPSFTTLPHPLHPSLLHPSPPSSLPPSPLFPTPSIPPSFTPPSSSLPPTGLTWYTHSMQWCWGHRIWGHSFPGWLCR